VFDGRSLDGFYSRDTKEWRVENGFLVNAIPQPSAMQTWRVFGDGEVRVRFQCRDQSYMAFHIRMDRKPGYLIEWTRDQVNQMAGAEHTLLFTCRGETVTASLDGKPLTVTARSASRKGTLFFSSVGGQLRIRSVDFRDLR